MRTFFKLLLRLLTRYEVSGPIPQTPPAKLLIVCNHQSFLDPVYIGVHCPFDIWWITHTQIAAQWHFRILLKFVPHLIVDTANPLAMKQVVELINSGKPVCIFPEGRISTTGSLMKAYDGFAFLAAKTDAALLPVNIDGLTRSYFTRLPASFPKFLRPKVSVRFFPPVHLPEPQGRTGRERRRKASHQVRQILERNYAASQPVTNLFDKFLESVETYGRKAEILSDIRFMPDSFGNVLRGALALGRLVSKITQEGEVVGVLMPNASPTVMLLFGMFGVKRVPAMINYTSGVDGMQSAIRTARIKTIISSRTFLEKAKLTEKVARLEDVQVRLLEDLRPQFGPTDKIWLMLWALRFPRRVVADVKPDDPAVILFTSGSEGKPKGVVLSHRAILSNVAQIRSVIEFSHRDKFLAALPLFHSFGLTVGALLPLTTGARVFLYPSPLHYRMIPEMAYDQDCTVLFGTGTFLARYAKMAHEYDFYTMRYVLSGAEKLPESVRAEYMSKFGIRIMEGYGVTECAPVVSVNTPMFHRLGSVGRFLPMIDYEVTPVPGIERGGLLHVRGPNLMSGYLLHSEPGKLQPPVSSVKGPGWYETGDIVEVDEDGFVRILGRVKRFAKVAGEMVSLEVVEQMANTASPGKAHAATTVSSLKRGEMILLYSEDRELRRDRLLAVAREGGMPEVAVPRQVQHVDKLPRLGSGKTDYVTLKELAVRDFPDPDAEQPVA
jgi:acyl-[acyl-carrier-protein]-phospholipid O-acyltransferase / long-chain-fatty-acid--[acyl-carrier-protein] ligase